MKALLQTKNILKSGWILVLTLASVSNLYAEMSSNFINLYKGVTPLKGDYEVIFNHRFNAPVTDSKPADLFGLDSGAVVGYGVNYGLTKRVALGLYRTTLLRNYNASVMVNIFNDRREWPTPKKNDASSEWKDDAQAATPAKDDYDFFTLGVRASVSFMTLIETTHNFSANGELALSKQFFGRFSIGATLYYVSKATGMDSFTAFWRENDMGFGLASEFRIFGGFFLLAETNIAFTRWSNRFYTYSAGLSYQTYGHDFKLFVTNSAGTTMEAIAFSQVAAPRIGFSIVRAF